jgi:hypothetical protein
VYRAQQGLLPSLLIVLTLACATAPPAKKEPGPLTKRARFDFNCPTSPLKFTRIDGDTVGVRGCGKRTVYVRVCDRGDRANLPYDSDQCRWLRQGEVQEDGPPPAE